MNKKDLIKFCLLYKGEKSLNNNPINKSKDEFKWYMWRCEFNAVRLAIKRKDFKSENNVADFMKNEIKAAIDLFADVPYGGNPTKLYDRYFSF